MVEMRKYGTGTYAGGVWRLKEKKDATGKVIRENVSKSPRQLGKLFGVELTGKTDSEPYWRKFLAALKAQDKAQEKARLKKLGENSPLQQRIRSLETLIAQFTEEGRDGLVAILERDLAEAQQVPAHDIDHHDGPVLHPDMHFVSLCGELDDAMVLAFNSLAPKPIPKAESLRAEIDAYLKRRKDNGNSATHTTKQYLDLFYEVTGPIRLKDIGLQHYRDFIDGVKGKSPKYDWNKDGRWGKMTQANIQQTLNAFLHSLENDHGLNLSFIRNRHYRISRPDGKKVKWPLEQVQHALKHATGDVRLALLLGLNCGWYTGDVSELTPDHFDGQSLKKSREKLKAEVKPLVGTWLVWEETKKVLAYERPQTTLNKAFLKFRREHNLLHHKGLRKTVSQWIEDNPEEAGGEQAARLYRCERSKGNHGKFYSEFTPEQVRIVAKALRFVEAKIFTQEGR